LSFQRSQPEFSTGEEIAHSVTHGLGAVLGIVGLVLLVRRALVLGDPRVLAADVVFGASMIVLYAASTLYHALTPPRVKRVFEILDHGAIYLLIAGTYTPFLVLGIGGTLGRTLLIVVWFLAVAGIVFKVFFTGRFRLVSTLLYIGMGWLIVVAVRPLVAAVPTPALVWLLAGGICYTGGTVFYLWRGLRFGHALWHLCVLAGTACHFVAVYRYLPPVG